MDHLDHDHTHDHDHSHDHDHPHTHEHTYDPGHTHEHDHGGEKTIAVLRYMLDHNVHHAAELAELAGEFSGETARLLTQAVEEFQQANWHLSVALDTLEEE